MFLLNDVHGGHILSTLKSLIKGIPEEHQAFLAYHLPLHEQVLRQLLPPRSHPSDRKPSGTVWAPGAIVAL